MNFSKIPSPCFVLDERKLQYNLETLAEIKHQAGIQIIVALKGFAFWSSFQMVRAYLDGATASSFYEAKLCHETLKNLAHTYAVAYSPQDFEKIKAISSHISFNSIAEFEKYYPSVFRFKKHKISCGLRLNPEFSVINDPQNDPSRLGSRLGIDLAQIKNGLPKGIEGIHVHCLCESPAHITAQLIDVLEEKFHAFLPHLKWLNLGGGHLLTQENYDKEILIEACLKMKKKYPNLQIILELGTAVGWQTGFLRASVLDVVENHNIKTLITDVSFSAHVSDSLSNHYPLSILGATKGNSGKHVYQIGGVSCLSNDFLGDYSFIKPVSIGDDIIFENMMSYTMVKTTFFNGLNQPSIGILDKNDAFKLVRKFSFADYKKRLG
jgi:carboxynorspermidine decarboxylase